MTGASRTHALTALETWETARATAAEALAQADRADEAAIRAEADMLHVAPALARVAEMAPGVGQTARAAELAAVALAQAEGKLAALRQAETDLRAAYAPDAPEVAYALGAAERAQATAVRARDVAAAQLAAAQGAHRAAARDLDTAQTALAAAEALRDGPWWRLSTPSVPIYAARLVYPTLARGQSGERVDPGLTAVLDDVLDVLYRDTGRAAMVSARIRTVARHAIETAGGVVPAELAAPALVHGTR